MNNIIEELKARGIWNASFGQVNELVVEGAKVYCGTDPTNPPDGSKASLHVGHLMMFTTARLLQHLGLQPIILIGTATCSLGDPSGKDQERGMMTMDRVMENSKAITEQVKKLLNFEESSPNHAIMVNNYEWMKNISFLNFEREVGKHISVNNMLTKESVKRRIEREGCGISHQEFSYMLIQAYDFYHLYSTMGCKLQMAGNDQQSNAGLGIELIRKKVGKDDVGAFFWPLLTNADGSKIGKTSGGKNVWLDPTKTSPYEFYQYFLNVSDVDAERFIKVFTLIPLNEINAMIEKHREHPSARLLQKELAKYMTCMVHSEEEYNKAVGATEILFGKGTTEQLALIEEDTLLSAMNGVPMVEVSKEELESGLTVLDLATMHDKVPSKNEARKLIKANGFSINKEKITNEKAVIDASNLINGRYLLLTKGRKEYTLVLVNG